MRHKDYNFLFNYYNFSAYLFIISFGLFRNSNSDFMNLSLLEWWHLMLLIVLAFLNAFYLQYVILLSQDHFQIYDSFCLVQFIKGRTVSPSLLITIMTELFFCHPLYLCHTPSFINPNSFIFAKPKSDPTVQFNTT
jgi:hypothetical protein